MDGRGITEAEVESVLPDDEESFLVRYVNYAKTQVGSPLAYHVGSALMLLSMTAPQMWCASRGFLAPTLANMWVMMVGRSGEAMKTLAIFEMKRVLADIAAETAIGSDPASEEALVKTLVRRPQQTLIYDDMGSFLSNVSSVAHNYRARIVDQATSLYDGSSFTREKFGRTLRVGEPRLGIVGGCTPIHIESFTTVLHWEGGFMSRFLILYAEAERDIRYRLDDWESYDWIVSRAKALWAMKEAYDLTTGVGKKVPSRDFWFGRDPSTPLGRCLGLDQDSNELWQSWWDRTRTRVRALPDRLSGVGSRAPLIAAKTATLLAWDRFVREREAGDVSGDWTINPSDMQAAIGIAELSFRSTIDLTRRVVTSDDARQKRVVLDAVGEDWTSQAVVFQDCGLLRKRANEALETLREEGLIERNKVSNVIYWKRLRQTQEEIAQEDAEDVGSVLSFRSKRSAPDDGSGENADSDDEEQG